MPQFGSFRGRLGCHVGFAILSDIEAYFFIEASQGDSRSNVLQAPKVTLFNGQLASVSDVSQSPFVISVIPVVGDFAAAQQPVIVVLSEGTMLTVQAVVSEDRRFVRLTLVPFFSSIGRGEHLHVYRVEQLNVEQRLDRPDRCHDRPNGFDRHDDRRHDGSVAHILVRQRQHHGQRA